MNQMNINQEKIKNPKPKKTVQNCMDTRKCMLQGMKIVYFIIRYLYI